MANKACENYAYDVVKCKKGEIKVVRVGDRKKIEDISNLPEEWQNKIIKRLIHLKREAQAISDRNRKRRMRNFQEVAV